MEIMSGLILLDKPAGLSSNQVLQRVKRIMKIKKAGHTGTLDPFATGMLPILIGSATRFANNYLGEYKRYRATMHLGQQTNTGDRDGQVISEQVIPTLDAVSIRSVFAMLQGARQQTPPLYSALKHQGKPLYQWAREGCVIPRVSRPIEIVELELINFGPSSIEFEVSCSKGTYIRTLVEEIAEKLGTVAYCEQLRRLTVGSFTSDQMLSIEALQTCVESGKTVLLSSELGLLNLPVFDMSETVLDRVKKGQVLDDSVVVPMGTLRLKRGDLLLGVGYLDERRIVKGRWL